MSNHQQQQSGAHARQQFVPAPQQVAKPPDPGVQAPVESARPGGKMRRRRQRRRRPCRQTITTTPAPAALREISSRPTRKIAPSRASKEEPEA